MLYVDAVNDPGRIMVLARCSPSAKAKDRLARIDFGRLTVIRKKAFWHELLPIVPPEFRTAVDGVRTDDDASAFGNVLASYGGIADGFADRDGDGGIQTQDFLADAVE